MHLLYVRAHCVFEENFVILNKHAHKKILQRNEKPLKKSSSRFKKDPIDIYKFKQQ